MVRDYFRYLPAYIQLKSLYFTRNTNLELPKIAEFSEKKKIYIFLIEMMLMLAKL